MMIRALYSRITITHLPITVEITREILSLVPENRDTRVTSIKHQARSLYIFSRRMQNLDDK